METILIIIIVFLFVLSIVGVILGALSMVKNRKLTSEQNNLSSRINTIDVDELTSIHTDVGRLITDIRSQYLSN